MTKLEILKLVEAESWLKKADQFTQNYLKSIGFKCKEGAYALLFSGQGQLKGAVAVVAEKPDIWAAAHLHDKLPQGSYELTGSFNAHEFTNLLAGLELAAYKYEHYKSKKSDEAKAPSTFTCAKADNEYITSLKEAVFLVRDLTNAPTEDMTPKHLAHEAEKISKKFKADFNQIVGDDLLKENYPVIHMVGRASSTPPRLIEIKWGKKKNPEVVLLGKGVCFDSGGLDLKSASNMQLMKKDMGGAANALGLAMMIMRAELPIRLRILIPAVENSVSGNAFRPLDVVKSRKGITIEIGNTDAEGRLILSDALAEADSNKPDLMIDMATLTGAARVALGPSLPAFFTPDDLLADKIMEHSRRQNDPLWRMPLWEPYKDMLKSQVADIINASDSPYGGAIAAALFLKEFVTDTKAWAHIDMMAWNPSSMPGRPKGAEAMAIRALFSLLTERYPAKKHD